MTAANTSFSVLVVDDDAWLAEQFVRSLEKEFGCKAAIAPDGVEAMNAIDESRPDVIILDMFMPGPNGMVLLHELQSHDDLATIPVVLCTNSATEVNLADLAPYGVVAMLDKATMHPDDLVATVRRIVV